ncbi:hypothetical protein G6O67_005334 [Ophiocordyceps sinensis]|uniref:Uncharacterized protein n=1 Tax=Ophiocordyceps sinensis TaxID=72228 RepID=A0A8H4PRC6_9HYPO|nr:hypothetical protein G6O67_005334 [Ophiocordyceps sinensis]
MCRQDASAALADLEQPRKPLVEALTPSQLADKEIAPELVENTTFLRGTRLGTFSADVAAAAAADDPEHPPATLI